MYSHLPEGYKCPICLGIKGVESEDTLIKQADIFYKDDDVTAFIGSFFAPNNPGYPLVVPTEHYENIYDIPEPVLHKIHDLAKKLSLVLKEIYKCDGVTLQQNNEPAGDQHAFHYHLHVISRFDGDDFHQTVKNR